MEIKELQSKSEFEKSKYERFILAGDVGGTNTYLAVLGVLDSKTYEIIYKCSVNTRDIKNFDVLLNEVMKLAKERFDVELSVACFGAAGAMHHKREFVKLTNVDLEINASEILAKTMLNKVILLNDFEAIGYGLDLLDIEKDVLKLEHLDEKADKSVRMNTYAVIGAGTGLGMSIAPYDSKKHLHVPMPSEGGHIDFSPQNELECELVKFLKKEVLDEEGAFPELESVLSGRGMENIYRYLRSKEKDENDTHKRITTLEGVEKLREIEANYEKDELCKQTVDIFMRFYARACRYLALISECYAGLFITGRIALKHKEKFKRDEFMWEFELHDKKSELLKKIPVYIIINPNVGLMGCTNVAINFFNL